MAISAVQPGAANTQFQINQNQTNGSGGLGALGSAGSASPLGGAASQTGMAPISGGAILGGTDANATVNTAGGGGNPLIQAAGGAGAASAASGATAASGLDAAANSLATSASATNSGGVQAAEKTSLKSQDVSAGVVTSMLAQGNRLGQDSLSRLVGSDTTQQAATQATGHKALTASDVNSQGINVNLNQSNAAAGAATGGGQSKLSLAANDASGSAQSAQQSALTLLK